MPSKTTKKKLKFLNKKEQSDLTQSIQTEKKNISQDFKHEFITIYSAYLIHFPVRKTVFTVAVNLSKFFVLTSVFLDKILGYFTEFGKKQNRYAELQMAWYLFTGKVLNITTRTDTDELLQNYVSEIKTNCDHATDTDIRIFLSCFMKSILDFFFKISIKIKSQQRGKSSVPIQKNFDDTSLYRIAGAAIKRMIRKRFSSKYLKRLTKQRQEKMTEERSLLRKLCLSKTEKKAFVHKLPVGFLSLDKGNLLVVKSPILNFVRVLTKEIGTNINNTAYSRLGCKMTHVAKLKLSNNKGLQFMFCSCVKSASSCNTLTHSELTTIYKELADKLFNTIVNEFVKRDKFTQNSTAQLMLRDKLKSIAHDRQTQKN